MEFNRVKKQIILALFVALIPASTVYPAWGWSSFTTSFSTVVSQLWNKASSALSEVSPKVAAVGAVLTAGVIAGVYWFKKNKDARDAEIRSLREQRDQFKEGERDQSVANSILDWQLEKLQERHDALEQQLKERADMVDVATQTDFDQYDQDTKYLDEQADEQWTRIEFLTPEVIKQQIVELKNSYAQLYQYACKRPVNGLAGTTKVELGKIRANLEQKKTDLNLQRGKIYTSISARIATVDEFYDCLKKEYDANSRTIQKNTDIELSPEQYYSYLCIDQADGFNMSSNEVMRLIHKKKALAKSSEQEKDLWVLRNLGYAFGNDASKEQFDAFLQGKGALKHLLFNPDVAKELLEMYFTLDESQMNIELYLSDLKDCFKKLVAKSPGNGNGKSPEDIE